MDASTLMLFVPACFALNMAPGPNNLLSVSNATRYGFRRSCLAGAGRLVAFAGMIALASAGLAAVLHTSELLFYGIKTAGAVYLFYLAWQLWRARADIGAAGADAAPTASWRQLARQEFFVAAGNPKAILIFTAFLPQFVDPAGAVGAQFFVLGVLFLLLEVVALAAYAWMGARMQRWFAQPRGKRIFNRTWGGGGGGGGGGGFLWGGGGGRGGG
uniref:LysE family translocator n=1 Tax=Pseudoduganella sp. OTU4001 TaxID=3043854 RepID=UPI00313BD2BD